MILILLAVLVIFAVLIAAALIIPVEIAIKLIKERSMAEGRISFGFLKGTASGHVDFSPEKREFRLQVLGVTLLKRPLEKRAEEKPKAEKPPTDWKEVAGHADELYAAGKELAGALVKNVSIKRLEGRVKVGLSDPAQTGMLVGFLYAGSGIAKAFLPEARLEIEPSFEEEQMDADLELELSLPLFKMIIPLIRFFRRTRKIF
ncbi:MAG TPA: DUF2953 domain-containing protein [Desulfobacteria bacterium]|nr:DUF2953 domain-containing protein [Desulfobacteria bacterium]